MPETPSKRQLLQGNEAIAHGALAAGCRFFAGYPITPASEISEELATLMPRSGGTFIQMEDEIASMGAIIGASLAGVKAMTATSGPGFSLIQENLGYACAAEVPCVVVNVMRGGPSTGLATSPAQGDVQMARWGTHGDHPIIVLAVSTVSDCFTTTIKAFNLSEQFRVPVIILSDEIVAHTRECVELPAPEEVYIINRIRPSVPPEWYKPYEGDSRGIPAMASFGDGYRHHITGLVHDDHGFPTENPGEILNFHQRLTQKITRGFPEIMMTRSYRLEDAEVAIIAYGSVARSAMRAVEEARQQGIRAGLLQLITLFPFPRSHVTPVLKQCRAVLVPEMNMGQISREVQRVNQSFCTVVKHNRVDGQVITPDELSTRLIKM
ncbi:2-oxoacid:acceptor oxidoreductase subunit alpha [Desulfobulbus alkaliphilus]|uniref:2-oxoacid:acceptor oxidoreductase subunit alpha n=1 Tax=Desulfobulbus alkaliphilus TaxID=869814 RepID=UPI00196489A0|nr:2-oxoacid:acceptor oxidoreductase subunit alpha [Desulfobulbus alkaliphilus]